MLSVAQVYFQSVGRSSNRSGYRIKDQTGYDLKPGVDKNGKPAPRWRGSGTSVLTRPRPSKEQTRATAGALHQIGAPILQPDLDPAGILYGETEARAATTALPDFPTAEEFASWKAKYDSIGRVPLDYFGQLDELPKEFSFKNWLSSEKQEVENENGEGVSIYVCQAGPDYEEEALTLDRAIHLGLLHREDGPAVEWSDGAQGWYQQGKLHRTDGPAKDYGNGSGIWVVDGEEICGGSSDLADLPDSEQQAFKEAVERWRMDLPVVNADEVIVS